MGPFISLPPTVKSLKNALLEHGFKQTSLSTVTISQFDRPHNKESLISCIPSWISFVEIYHEA